jgi:hypothetical protein
MQLIIDEIFLVASSFVDLMLCADLTDGYRYLGDKTGPIKPLSQPLKRDFLPRPGHFNKRVLSPYRF